MGNLKEKNYTKGFNAGYIIERYGERNFDDIEKYEFQNSFLLGVLDGRKQARIEKGLEGRSELVEQER